MKRLEGKVAIITGGAKGIGFATAKKFAQEGAITIIVDIDENALKLARIELKKYGEVVTKVLNITDRDAVEKVFSEVADEFGRIDSLVNNAGIISDNQLERMTYDQFDKVIDINLKGTFNCAKAVIPYMVKQGSGSITNASSIVGVYGNYGQTNYSASKWGVIGMMKCWAREYGKNGVRSNAVAPGFIDTPILAPIPEKVMEKLIKGIPMRRLGKDEEIANVYAFLASDEAGYINGAVIEVSGGKTL